MNKELVLFGLKEAYDACVNANKTNGIYTSIEETIDVSRASVLFDPESYVGRYRSFKIVQNPNSVEPGIVYGLVVAGRKFDLVVTMSDQGEIDIELYGERSFDILSKMFKITDAKDWLLRHIAVGMSLKEFVKAFDILNEDPIQIMYAASKKAMVPLTRMLNMGFSRKKASADLLSTIEQQLSKT